MELVHIPSTLLDPQDRIRERVGVGGRDQRAVDPVTNDLRRTAGRERDDRRAGCERLDADDPEVILRGKDETARGAQQLTERRVIEVPRERDVVARHPLEGAALASFADNDETHAEPSEGADRDVRALVRGQTAHVDPEVTTLLL